MGLFGTKEKNYDTEIALLSEQQALLNEKQNALSERTDKNNSDVIGINEAFFTFNRKQYLKFLEQIGGPDKFLNFVNFKLNFIIESD